MLELIKNLLLIAAGMPLLAYPGVLLASVMGLGSPPYTNAPLFHRLMNKFFLWGTLLYPLVFGVCYRLSEHHAEYGYLIALIPLIFLGLLALSFRHINVPPPSADPK